MEFFDTSPPVAVLDSEYQRLLGYPAGHELTGRSRELADATRAWHTANGKPWIYAREVAGIVISNDKLRIGETEFTSKRLCDQQLAAGAHTAVLVAVSAGPQCEARSREFWQEGKPDEYFFMEMYGSAVVEHLITLAGARICDWAERAGMSALPHYSPGYSGWDVAEQNKLWELIRGDKTHEFPGELEVLDTGMLRPKKSLLAVFGITRQQDQAFRLARLVPCESCAFSPCQYRRAPYKRSLPQIEDVRRLQPERSASASSVRQSAPALNQNASYSINARALRKWSQERLALNVGSDGAVEARFRYEGTTCSNMGKPLTYDYRVRLHPPEQNYEIAELACQPASDDTGHAAQCAYLNDGAELRRKIADEKPLLGRPLNDVLGWQRPFDPAGCYCEASSRVHKWGLVFEVIHYALVQRALKQTNGQPATNSEYSRLPT